MNFVHAKAIVTQDQTVHMTGALAGQPVDQNVVWAHVTALSFGASFHVGKKK